MNYRCSADHLGCSVRPQGNAWNSGVKPQKQPLHVHIAAGGVQRNVGLYRRSESTSRTFFAQQIKTLAISNGIPIYEAPSLARAIYHTTLINHEVPPALYMAVAIVLSYVFQLKNYQHGIGQLPLVTDNLEIPKDYIYHD